MPISSLREYILVGAMENKEEKSFLQAFREVCESTKLVEEYKDQQRLITSLNRLQRHVFSLLTTCGKSQIEFPEDLLCDINRPNDEILKNCDDVIARSKEIDAKVHRLNEYYNDYAALLKENFPEEYRMYEEYQEHSN